MKRGFFQYILSFTVALLLAGPFARAQAPRVNVRGTVTNPISGTAVSGVKIYGFSTKAAAMDTYRSLVDFYKLNIPPTIGECIYMISDDMGYYEMPLPPDGAIVFFHSGAKAPVIKNVNWKQSDGDLEKVVNAEIVVGMLKGATIEAEMEGLEADTEAELEGNNWNLKHTVYIPEALGKSNARLIFQPFVLSADRKDTLEFRKPLVYDGTEYRLTQERRLGFNTDLDPLYKYFKDTLSAAPLKIEWVDTIFIEDPTIVRHANSITRIEDYTNIYFEQEDEINSTDKIRRPLKFLDYNIGTRTLDPQNYYVPPKKEKMPGSANLSISFLVGKAVIDPKDTLGRSQLEGLKENFRNIINGEGSALTEFGIVAKASPDGTYAKNVALARERMEYAFNEVLSAIPRNYRRYVYMWKESKVATWIEVAEAMEADSLMKEGQAIRDIVAKYPKNPDAQFNHIRQLSFYRPTIVGYFPKLRSMSCLYESTVFRALTPQEIVANYYDEKKGYRSGKNPLSINEFWNLFTTIKDEDELEHLYKLAYDQTMKTTGKPWILAANNLAETYIRKDKVDTTILESFIDLRFDRCDYVVKTPDPFGNITEEVFNPKEVICNQLAMYLKDNNFRSASVLAKLLPDTEEYSLMKAFTRVLGGYYKGGRTAEDRAERRKNFEIVSESSPLNKVVMNLAANYDAMAEEALPLMEDGDPLKSYLRVVIESRKHGTKDYFPFDLFMLEQELIAELQDAFTKRPDLVPIAASDPDINEPILKEATAGLDTGKQ